MQPIIRKSDGTLTAYGIGELTTQHVIDQIKKLRRAFPQLQVDFTDILLERAKEKKWTDRRLTDAVNNLIDTCQYPQPTLANVLSYDKRIKTYSYTDMCDMAYNYGSSVWQTYKRLSDDIAPGRWAHVSDVMKYNLKTKNDEK